MKITSISATLLELRSIARTTAPPVGIVIVNVGFSSVKCTPFEMRSCLLDISLGAVLIEFIAISVSIYSISSQIFCVLEEAVAWLTVYIPDDEPDDVPCVLSPVSVVCDTAPVGVLPENEKSLK